MTKDNSAKDELYLAIQKAIEQKPKVNEETKKRVHDTQESEEEIFINEIGDDD